MQCSAGRTARAGARHAAAWFVPPRCWAPSRLIPITRAHVDSCLYHGEASLDFAERLVDGGARVAVPTTLNVGALDLLHPELWHGDPRTAERGRLLMDRYRALGCRPTYTCAPYQLPDAAARASVSRSPGRSPTPSSSATPCWVPGRTVTATFTDIACAIAGRVPDAGLHRTDARRAQPRLLRMAPDLPARAVRRRLLLRGAGHRARPARRLRRWPPWTDCRRTCPRTGSRRSARPRPPPARSRCSTPWAPPPRRPPWPSAPGSRTRRGRGRSPSPSCREPAGS